MIGQWLDVTYLEEEKDYKIDYWDGELDVNFSGTINIELEKRLVKKLKRGSILLSELLIPGTEYIYKHPLRTRMEIEGGAKIALMKGARLNEVKVFNLVVRFKNKRYDNSKALAFMYRPLKNKDEWIVLQPDNTALTMDLEKYTIGWFADDYYMKGRMTRQQKDHLEQNP